MAIFEEHNKHIVDIKINKDQNEILEEAVDKFGAMTQLDMVVEECAELIQAISKFKRYEGSEIDKNLIEEVADVSVMIAQIPYILSYVISTSDLVLEPHQKHSNISQITKTNIIKKHLQGVVDLKIKKLKKLNED